MNQTNRIKFRKPWALCFPTIVLCASSIFAGTPLTVNVPGDGAIGAGGTFSGSSGDLRGVLNQINLVPDTYDVTFALGGSNTIAIGAMLPLINLVNTNPVTIDGANGGTQIVIDGGNAWRGFFAVQGNITLKNLTIQNVVSRGGKGGGGGMGAGAGLFVDAARVTLSNIGINNAAVIGGEGGGSSSGTVGISAGGGGLGAGNTGSNGGNAPGGGGGLGGNGGSGNASSSSGGGGGINCGTNHLGTGGSAVGLPGLTGGGIGGSSGGAGPSGGAGGASGGGGGAGGGGGNPGGGGGSGGFPGNTGGSGFGGPGGYGGGGGAGDTGTSSDLGGFGGFGGGGSGADGGVPGIPVAGAGGFGGGGGSTFADSPGSSPGIGGFGGGGGGGWFLLAGGGDLSAAGGVGGGQGVGLHLASSFGGGGAGFGGALFVNTGSLTVDGFFGTNGTNSATAGAAAGGEASPGWAAGNDCFFLTGSSITLDPNGNTITITNSIADDSSASFVGKPDGVTGGTANGAFITIGNSLSMPGTVLFSSSNHSTYSGTTLVQAGNFVLDGSIISPVTVFNGAKLKGTGTVLNSVMINSGGAIQAGNSIGNLTVGSLILNDSTSILELDIDLSPNSNNSSVYVVNGPVTLNNAILQLNFTTPSQFTAHTYDFIQYNGGNPGIFGSITLIPGFQSAVIYGSNLISLNLTPFSDIIGVGVTLSSNQRTILTYLLGLFEVPSLQNIFQDLASLTPDQLRDALNSISPARNAAASYFANQSAFGLSRIPLVRLRDGRVLSHFIPKWKNNSLAAVLATKNESFVAMAADTPVPSMPANLDPMISDAENPNLQQPAGSAKTAAAKSQNYGFWAAGYGDFLSQDGQNSNPKIKDTAAGAVLGFDYYGCQNGIFNISTGYIHNDITEGDHAGSGTSNGAVLSVYGTGYIGNGYLEGGMLGSYNHFHMKRDVVIPGPFPFHATAKSSFNDWLVMPHLGGGYDWMMNWGVIEPFASVDWAVSFQRAYKETGASPLNMQIKGKTPSILRSQIGLNIYETWDNEKYAFIFQQSASYVNKALFNTKMSAAIVIPTVIPAGSFTVQSYNKTLNLGAVGLELFYKHKPTGFFLSTTYQGEFGSSYMSNDITGTVGVFF